MNKQPKTQPEAPLPKYYDVEDAGDEWNLWCKRCGKGWALSKQSTHPGNLLHLLDHARSHTNKKEELR